MGGAIFTPIDKNSVEYYASQVVRDEYEVVQVYLKSESPVPLSEAQIASILGETYKDAIQEHDLALSDCRCPGVILFKYLLLSQEEKDAHTSSVLNAAIVRDKDISRNAKKVEDYSKSFGGTEADSKNEKAAAELMRGSEGNKQLEDDIHYPLLARPRITHVFQHNTLKIVGVWSKFLSASGCYMYVHSLTKEVVSLRPAEYEDTIDPSSLGDDNATPIDPANGMRRIELSELPEVVDQIIKETQRTPLIFDCSQTQPVRTFFTYKARMEDISCLTVPFGKSGLKREDVMERCRVRLVSALKSGTQFVLYMGSVTIEHADLKTKLCKKDVFPKEVFQGGGLKLLGPDYDPKYKAVYREADLESGQAVYREGFQACVVTSVDPFRYEELLGDCIPLGYMTPIYVNFAPGN